MASIIYSYSLHNPLDILTHFTLTVLTLRWEIFVVAFSKMHSWVGSELEWKKIKFTERLHFLVVQNSIHCEPLWEFSHQNILTMAQDSWSIQYVFFLFFLYPSLLFFCYPSELFITRSSCVTILTILEFSFSSAAIFGMDFVGSFAVLVMKSYICFLLTLTIAHDYGLVQDAFRVNLFMEQVIFTLMLVFLWSHFPWYSWKNNCVFNRW